MLQRKSACKGATPTASAPSGKARGESWSPSVSDGLKIPTFDGLKFPTP